MFLAGPGPQNFLPSFDALSAREAQAEAVAAVREKVGLDRYLARQQRLTKQQRVGDRHRWVVLRMEEKRGWCVGGDIEVRRMGALALARSTLADQVGARAGMGGRQCHRHHRIDWR